MTSKNVPAKPSRKSTPAENTKAVVDQLGSQHAIHGLMGSVFDRLGGEDWLLDWAKEHETQFVKMLVSSTPSMAPLNTVSGDVHVHVHSELKPSDLDDPIDVTPNVD